MICCENYTEDDIVSELNCDERHVFHTACLTEWMKQKTICPLCKRTVSVNGSG